MKIEYGCGFVVCVTSGEGFKKGVVYPAIGHNNGLHILREDSNGDLYDLSVCTGGVGIGEFNTWDDSGEPSFNALDEDIEGET